MIGSLHGRLTIKEADRVVIETGGIGWLVLIPFSTFFALGDIGSEVRLLVHTNVREDAIQLFGFISPLELAVFHRLIGVSGIGPKMAMNVLSGIPARDLVAAIRDADLSRLSAVPGLGKKTSERLVVELRDKMDGLVVAGPRSTTPATAASGPRDDAVSALVNLGYRRKDAEDTIDRVANGATLGIEDLLKAALTRLSR